VGVVRRPARGERDRGAGGRAGDGGTGGRTVDDRSSATNADDRSGRTRLRHARVADAAGRGVVGRRAADGRRPHVAAARTHRLARHGGDLAPGAGGVRDDLAGEDRTGAHRTGAHQPDHPAGEDDADHLTGDHLTGDDLPADDLAAAQHDDPDGAAVHQPAEGP
jgi:hypothetical protein